VSQPSPVTVAGIGNFDRNGKPGSRVWRHKSSASKVHAAAAMVAGVEHALSGGERVCHCRSDFAIQAWTSRSDAMVRVVDGPALGGARDRAFHKEEDRCQD
jgi:hypothetical protein